jgi:Uma2 family endonuclease
MSSPLTIRTREAVVSLPKSPPTTLAEFRAWAGDNDLPEKTRVDFYKGQVWVDMGTEQVFSHGAVKTEIAGVLRSLCNKRVGDLLLINGVLVTNIQADLSGNPDMVFVFGESLDNGRVRLVEGAEEGYTELEGTVDMVMEIVSPSSVAKDTVTLRRAYWEAGIPEYWLVNARNNPPALSILKHGSKGYTETRPQGGWLKSGVFGKSFKLTREDDPRGYPVFTLDVK